jgi:hypothetical protein
VVRVLFCAAVAGLAVSLAGCEPVGYRYAAPVYADGYYGGYVALFTPTAPMASVTTAAATSSLPTMAGSVAAMAGSVAAVALEIVAKGRKKDGSSRRDRRPIMVDEALKAAPRLDLGQPQDQVAVALPAASVYVQHGPLRQGLGDGDEGGLGEGDADHWPRFRPSRVDAISVSTRTNYKPGHARNKRIQASVYFSWPLAPKCWPS